MNVIKTRFFDGIHFKPYQVIAKIETQGLSITYDDPTLPSLFWKFETLEVIVECLDDIPGKISSQLMPNARLIIEDVIFYNAIIGFIPRRNIHFGAIKLSWSQLGLLAVAMSGVMALAIFAMPYFSMSAIKIVPLQWDEKIGDAALSQWLSGKKVCVGETGGRALQKIISRLQAYHQNQPLHYDVLIVEGDTMNAFTFPGNHIIIYNGLIQKITAPDELAAIIGHEMGHAIYRHPTVGLIQYGGMYLILYQIFGGQADFANQIINLKYSRDFERQADDEALILLNQSHISPKGFVDMMSIFEDEDKGVDGEYLSTHPRIWDRQQKAERAIKPGVQYHPSLSNTQWANLKGICSKTVSYKELDKKNQMQAIYPR